MMNEQEHIRAAIVSTFGEARTTEMEAHLAASSMTLSDYLEAVATRPGGACDQFGVPDTVTGRDLATTLQAARLLEQAETLRIVLSQDPAAMFQNRSA
ncbi:hypothetical protein I6F36_06425 [Bradyrhizobium sp. BRP19]|uniref:hypothetical protein n=1 Tax=Bradyrhizobium sp. BRP19 TaxID=2793823 RepID=UPI001CD21EF5|nr:hypothetical protein [Bradyrhizobium sp. BRP19]MCA1546440.1 hypothetical protein [Bradyrhizobium sp. BRP19]